MIKVLIADDHPVVRSGVRQCITGSAGMQVVHEAGTAREVFDYLERAPCDIVLLDINLPDQSGLEVLRVIKEKHPALPVLILTMFPEEQYAVHCLRAGAAGFLNKSHAPNLLPEVIRKIARGGRYISPALAESMAFTRGEVPAEPTHESLSGREFQIFRQIATGQTQKAIAAELALSVKTVSTHRTRILKKMRMESNADIVRYALNHQLIS